MERGLLDVPRVLGVGVLLTALALRTVQVSEARAAKDSAVQEMLYRMRTIFPAASVNELI